MQKSDNQKISMQAADFDQRIPQDRSFPENVILVGKYLLALLLPMTVGILSASLSRKGITLYKTMDKPPLAPPAFLFPLAWTILYFMMGSASYIVLITNAPKQQKSKAAAFYLVQLAMNFFWSIIFFNLEMYLFAFLWLIAMWCIVIICTLRFLFINKLAGCLLIPYVLWLTFAGYLNLGAFILQANNAS